MTTQGVSDLAPASFSATCAHQPVLCPSAAAGAPATPGERFTDAQALQLVQKVNVDVNSAMAPASLLINLDDDWAPAVETSEGLIGDCKSFAAEKRRRLLAAGFPPERLFYAVVFRQDIGLHALLMVRLNTGDYAMDSREPTVVPWRRVDYLYVERQAADDPYHWVNLVAPPAAVAGTRLAEADRRDSRSRPTAAGLSIALDQITPRGLEAARLAARLRDADVRVPSLALQVAAASPVARAANRAGAPPRGRSSVGGEPWRLARATDRASAPPFPGKGLLRAASAHQERPVVVRDGAAASAGACSPEARASGLRLLDKALAKAHPKRLRLRRTRAEARLRPAGTPVATLSKRSAHRRCEVQTDAETLAMLQASIAKRTP